MNELGFSRHMFLATAVAFVLGACGGDDQTSDGGSPSPTSSDDSTAAGTSAGSSESETATSLTSTASADGSSATTHESADDGSSTQSETTSASTESSTSADTGEVCACTGDLPACDEAFAPGGECGRSANERCCHVDGPYTCICPFNPPCEWTKDECR